jgi:hypothetical protein
LQRPASDPLREVRIPGLASCTAYIVAFLLSLVLVPDAYSLVEL